MSFDDLLKVLQTMHEVFPLPVDETFKGTHGIRLGFHPVTKQPSACFLIWYKHKDGTIRGREAGPDPGELPNKEFFETVKSQIKSADEASK